MDRVAFTRQRFAEHEFTIRRHYDNDPDFRDICDDYTDALRASEVWADDENRSEYYHQLVRELEEEIFSYVGRKSPATR